jgi:hypothetical protein
MKLLRYFTQKQKETPKRTLSRVHLIVHPGDGMNENNPSAHSPVLQAIAQRARGLVQANEAAVILLQMSPDEWQHARDPASDGKNRRVAEAIMGIEVAMPQNTLVVPGAPSVLYPCLDGALEKIRRRLEALGFRIDERTEVLAYGEMATRCVPDAAVYFARHFGLQETPLIDLNCTDVATGRDAVSWGRTGIKLRLERILKGGSLRYIPVGETPGEAD